MDFSEEWCHTRAPFCNTRPVREFWQRSGAARPWNGFTETKDEFTEKCDKIWCYFLWEINTFSLTSARKRVTRAPLVSRVPRSLIFVKVWSSAPLEMNLPRPKMNLKISEIWLLSTAGNQYASSDISKETVSHAPPVATRAQFEPRAFGK